MTLPTTTATTATADKVVAVSYTGGKDCTLALHRIKEQGAEIAVLVTFTPPLNKVSSFKAHSFDIIQAQAKALSLPHTICIIEGPDYLGDYQREITKLRQTYGIAGLVTGDILPVCSNFMERAVEGTGVQLIRPLWQQDQLELLSEMWIQRGFEIMVTCINLQKIPAAVLEQVGHGKQPFGVGQYLTRTGLDALNAALAEKDTSATISPTGEYGELHTMVTKCPLYEGNKLLIEGETNVEDHFAFLRINRVALVAEKI